MDQLAKLVLALSVVMLSLAAQAAPPRVTGIEPAASESGLWVVDQAGLSQVRIEFDQMIVLPADAVTVWTINEGLLADALVQQDTLSSLQITFAGAVHEDIVTIVVDHTVTNFQGEALDGQIAQPSNPALPSGNGMPGGPAVFRINVLQGDVNRDGVVDDFDAVTLLTHLGLCEGDAGYSTEADLNGDGCINVLDVNILSSAMGTALPETGSLGLQVLDITPDPQLPLSDDVHQIEVQFAAPIHPDAFLTNSCFLLSSSGELINASHAELDEQGMLARYSFNPAAPQCDQYTINISNALASDTGALLTGPTSATISGVVQIPPPTIGRHDTLTNAQSIALTGTAGDAAMVRVSGLGGVAEAPVRSGTWSVSAPLKADALNTLYVSAISACGVASSPTTTQVVMDSQPPTVTILNPAGDAEIIASSITVSGLVGDALSGSLGLNVSVNGVRAGVDPGIGTNGSFEAINVPLQVGSNVIAATATDAAGNTAAHSITIERIEPPSDAPTLTLISGTRQSAQVNTQLPQPITVQVQRPDGTAFANKLVNFRITRSDGRVSPTPGKQGGLLAQTYTDSKGHASVYWTLGSDSGSGNNRLEITSQSVPGALQVSASASAGSPSRIVVSGNNFQRGQTGATLGLPLTARVLDGQNPVGGVAVTFTVIEGDGHFAGSQQVKVFSGNDGTASVGFTLGSDPGVNRIEADFAGNIGQAVQFTAMGIEATLGQATRFSGVVLDNGGRAIGGAQALLQVNGQNIPPVQTDINGRFSFEDIADGSAMFFVNASMATTLGGEPIPPGTFPALQYEDVIIVPGADNALATPVRFPMLDPANQRNYSTTQQTVLEVQGIEGLRMIIEPGSMTLANGMPAPNGTVVRLNQVHFDQVPMPLPDGAAPPFAWTLTPGGATFDPPIRIEIPNMTGLAPGAVTSFTSFNHDTGRFEIVGRGAVNEDGSMIVSDPGSGLTLSGWGGLWTPPPAVMRALNCAGKGLWGLAKGAASGVGDALLALTDLSDLWNCSEGLLDASAGAIQLFQVSSADGTLSCAERMAMLSTLSGLQTAANGCGNLFLNKASQLNPTCLKLGIATSAISGAAADASEAGCLGSSGAVINQYIQATTATAGNVCSLQNGFSAKDAAIVAANSVVEAIKIELACDGALGGDDSQLIAQLTKLFAEFEAHMEEFEALDKPAMDAVAAIEAAAPGIEDDAEVILADLETSPQIAGCTVTVGAQSVQANEGGGFSLSNVPADGGLLVINIVCEDEGGNSYGQSAFFEPLPDGELVSFEPLTLGPNPPLAPVGLSAGPAGIMLLKPGQSSPLSIVGTMNDGSQQTLNTLGEGTWYQSTNPAIADVSTDGLVTAGTTGTAFIIASNQGVSATKRVDVVSSIAQTTIAGFVQLSDGSPVPSAAITTLLGGKAFTQADGSFTLNLDVPAGAVSVSVLASAQIGKDMYSGSALAQPIVPNGITDAGVIVLNLSGDVPTCSDLQWLDRFNGASSVNGIVRAMAVFDDGSGPALYVGGEFTTAGGVTVNRIARWDGKQWSPLGSGVNGTVWVLRVLDDGSGPALYAGGDFWIAGEVTASGVAKWDGKAWSALGDGVSGGSVYDIIVFDDGLGDGPNLYVTGSFSGAGGTTAWRIARWDGKAWSNLAGGLNASFGVYGAALAVFDDGTGPALFVGGNFPTPGPRIAKWNGTQWSALPGGGPSGTFNNSVQALLVHDDGSGSGPGLYMTGVFLNVPNNPGVNRIARYDANGWSGLSSGLNNQALELLTFDDGTGTGPALFAAGEFTTAGDVPANRIAKWDGKQWSPLGTGLNNWSRALAVFDDGSGGGPGLYLGGNFTTAGDDPAPRIALWGCPGSSMLIAGNGSINNETIKLRERALQPEQTPRIDAQRSVRDRLTAGASPLLNNPDALARGLNAAIGEALYDAQLDLNGDGVINVLDVHAAQQHPQHHHPVGAGSAEIILADGQVTHLQPGGEGSLLVKLFNNDAPLFGYSLAVRAVPIDDAQGSVSINVPQSSFFDQQHLILADPNGAPLDDIFSIIQGWGDDGAFVSANTADGSVVVANFDINDVLAHLAIEASPDAHGVFELQFGPATVLSDGNGFAVNYHFCGGRIAVGVDEPSPSDLTGNGTVDIGDLLLLLSNWGPCIEGTACAADQNCDNTVDVYDLLILLGNWETQ